MTPTTEAPDLVERLTRPIIGIKNRTSQEAFDIMTDRIRMALAAIPSQAGEVERLRKRLEVVEGWSEDADGIACRDATIKLLEDKCDTLRAELAEQRRTDIITMNGFREACYQRDTLRAELAARDQEIARLTKMTRPQWFYLGDDTSSDNCSDSVNDALDVIHLNPGETDVFQISTATSLPSIWALVHCQTEEEKNAADDDDDWVITEFATEEEAHEALKGPSDGTD